jgi:hypothetical protein
VYVALFATIAAPIAVSTPCRVMPFKHHGLGPRSARHIEQHRATFASQHDKASKQVPMHCSMQAQH